jgi:hypothetical protein
MEGVNKKEKAGRIDRSFMRRNGRHLACSLAAVRKAMNAARAYVIRH